MPLPIYDAQDAVPEDQRDEYVEHEGKWHPKAVVELAAERTKRAKLLSERKEEKERREAAERERDELKTANEAREGKVPEAALQKIRDDLRKEIDPLKAELETVRSENLKLKRDDKVRALYLKHDGMSDRVDDAMDQLLKRTELGDADGIVFKDEKGQVTADDGETFFKKFRVVKPWLFKGSGASGSGAEGSNGSGGSGQQPAPKEALEQKRQELQGAL